MRSSGGGLVGGLSSFISRCRMELGRGADVLGPAFVLSGLPFRVLALGCTCYPTVGHCCFIGGVVTSIKEIIRLRYRISMLVACRGCFSSGGYCVSERRGGFNKSAGNIFCSPDCPIETRHGVSACGMKGMAAAGNFCLAIGKNMRW